MKGMLSLKPSSLKQCVKQPYFKKNVKQCKIQIYIFYSGHLLIKKIQKLESI